MQNMGLAHVLQASTVQKPRNGKCLVGMLFHAFGVWNNCFSTVSGSVLGKELLQVPFWCAYRGNTKVFNKEIEHVGGDKGR